MNLPTLWMEHPALQIAVYLGAAFLAALIVRSLWFRLLSLITARTKTKLDEHIAKATATPVAAATLVLGLWLTARFAERQDLLPTSWLSPTRTMVRIAVIYIAAFVINGIIQASLRWYAQEVAPRTTTRLDEDLIPLVRKIVFIMLLFIATAMALKELGTDITALVATASVASLAVALAAQETLSNMLAGFMIMLDRPFRVGDRIRFEDGQQGRVVHIGLRSTRVQASDGTFLVVPNKILANERIVNYELEEPTYRVTQRFGVGYDSDIEQVRKLTMDVVLRTETVLTDPAPGLYFLEFGPSSLDFTLTYWVERYDDAWSAQNAVNAALKEAFDQNGITFPYPQQDVHIKELPAQERTP